MLAPKGVGAYIHSFSTPHIYQITVKVHVTFGLKSYTHLQITYVFLHQPNNYKTQI